MSLLAPGALAGLLLLVPLVVLHLRHRRPPTRTVPSLLLEGPPADAPRARARRWGRPPLPLLLALQVLAVVLLVVALAQPAGPPKRSGGVQSAYVLDGSLWMQARDGSADRMTAARARLRTLLAAVGDESVAIVLADAAPHVVYRGPASGAAGAVAGTRATATPSTLPAAVAVAADLRDGSRAPLTVLHAPEDPAPRARAAAGVYVALAAGAPVQDLGFTTTAARCGLAASGQCEVLATVQQTSGGAADVPVLVRSGRRTVATATAHLPAGAGSAPVVLTAPPGAGLVLSLPGGDALAADDRTAVAVPANPTPYVNVVAAYSRLGTLTRAFQAIPGAQVRAITPADYRASDARDASLLVLDGWLPPGGLPPARSVLLVDPPRIPGGTVHGRLADGSPSGSDPASPLLTGIDVGALTADTESARDLTTPAWVPAAVWAPGGPLLSAGTDGVHRLAVLAFDPGESSLPQSEAFPLLAANLVTWAQDWVPTQARPGDTVLAQTPPGTISTERGPVRSTATPAAFPAPVAGATPVSQHEDWGARSQPVGVGVDATPPAAGAVDLRIDPAAAISARDRGAPWLLLAALLVLLGEWLLVLRLRRRTA